MGRALADVSDATTLRERSLAPWHARKRRQLPATPRCSRWPGVDRCRFEPARGAANQCLWPRQPEREQTLFSRRTLQRTLLKVESVPPMLDKVQYRRLGWISIERQLEGEGEGETGESREGRRSLPHRLHGRTREAMAGAAATRSQGGCLD